MLCRTKLDILLLCGLPVTHKLYPQMSDSFCRIIELQPDQLSGSLGLLDKPQPAKPISVTETSDRALYDERKNRTTECRVNLIQHGTFRDKSAVLVVFRFTFWFDSRSSQRIVRAGIHLSFDSFSGNSEVETKAKEPVVVEYCPALLQGPVTKLTRSRKKYVEAPLLVNIPSTPLQAGVNLGVADKEEYIEDCKTSIKGLAFGSTNRIHRLKWAVEENRALREGIPASFMLAAVVQNNGLPIQAMLKLEAYSGRRKLLGTPWTAEQPLLIDSNVMFGKLLNNDGFEKLDEDDWRQLIHAELPNSVGRLILVIRSYSDYQTVFPTHAGLPGFLYPVSKTLGSLEHKCNSSLVSDHHLHMAIESLRSYISVQAQINQGTQKMDYLKIFVNNISVRLTLTKMIPMIVVFVFSWHLYHNTGQLRRVTQPKGSLIRAPGRYGASE